MLFAVNRNVAETKAKVVPVVDSSSVAAKEISSNGLRRSMQTTARCANRQDVSLADWHSEHGTRGCASACRDEKAARYEPIAACTTAFRGRRVLGDGVDRALSL